MIERTLHQFADGYVLRLDFCVCFQEYQVSQGCIRSCGLVDSLLVPFWLSATRCEWRQLDNDVSCLTVNFTSFMTNGLAFRQDCKQMVDARKDTSAGRVIDPVWKIRVSSTCLQMNISSFNGCRQRIIVNKILETSSWAVSGSYNHKTYVNATRWMRLLLWLLLPYEFSWQGFCTAPMYLPAIFESVLLRCVVA